MPRSIRRSAKQPSNSSCKSLTKSNKPASQPRNWQRRKKFRSAIISDALTTMRGQASDLGSNWFLTRNLNFSRDYLDAVQKVTLDDIKRVAATYLTDDNLTIVSLNPKGSLAGKAEEAKVASAGEIQKFELSNGLRILVREDRAFAAGFDGRRFSRRPSGGEPAGLTASRD